MDSALPQTVVAPATNAAPGVISYQGTLTDAAGKPVTGNVDITFRLFAAPTGGTALWTEAHTGANAVPVSNGLFNVLLGSLTPIPASVWSNANVYLGVRVAGDTEMSPREIIGAVPVAMAVPDGSITSAKIADGAVTGEKIDGELIAYQMTQQIPVSVSGARPNYSFQVDIVMFPTAFLHKTLAVVAWLNVPGTHLGIPIAPTLDMEQYGFFSKLAILL